ncbi:hypothetical protein ccbrp13_71720 [Ktedonobacteria bacterium brp13]|nr:hypothetical protein ccbrp13_13640 [Ktedonobacteria bacterium brp13]BCL78997.1 hypothetical protein ccbrp13_14620 [Ktedonobacteria bacterium brp13]BCL84707.1 hypothetical protein ccbrp13_71720 [Ktedonobacteria bacterium brp13]
MTHPSVHLQLSSEVVPSVPSWFGEVAIVAQLFTTSGVLKSIEEQVRFARARFGIYELIDFVAVLIGYAVSAEPTLLAFYDRLMPFATPFMALFGRQNLPHRSTLSRFLASLDQPTVEAWRSLFLEDLVLRTAQTFPPGGLWDRLGRHWLVIDVDGTKQAARQRALPSLAELPSAHRRFDRVCAPAYLGRKRGEVARTRTTVLQAHSHHWLGTFGGPGNGDYRGELARAHDAILSYAGWLCMPLSQIMIRLDGLYGNGGVLKDLVQSGVGITGRSKDYGLLDLPSVQTRLQSPADQQTTHPESGASRSLFDCPAVPLTPTGPCVRLIVATHPTSSTSKPPIGVLRDAMVYELFLTTASPSAFTCADVLDLYLHRGSFETVLSDEDQEQSTDRWCSHTACGQEFWQILSQWLWNLRLDLGQHLSPSPLRVTEFAPAAEPLSVPPSNAVQEPLSVAPHEPPRKSPSVPANEPVHYGPPQWARPSFTRGFAGSDFEPQPDGSVRCPAGHPLTVQERRPERHGLVRVVYGARIAHCRPCPLRAQCQESLTTRKPRQVSAVLWPIDVTPSVPVQPSPPTVDVPIEGKSPPPPAARPPASALAPVLWGDWPRCQLRRSFVHLLRTQTVELTLRARPPEEDLSSRHEEVQTRAQRAHWRLTWQQRMARNARPASAPPVEVTIYGLPVALAAYVGANQVTAA